MYVLIVRVQVLVQLFLDPLASVLLRAAAMDVLVELLHTPAAMLRFTSRPTPPVEPQVESSPDRPMKKPRDESEQEAHHQSCQERILRQMLSQSPPLLLLAAFQRMCGLCETWGAACRFRDAVEQATAGVLLDARDYDGLSAPILKSLRALSPLLLDLSVSTAGHGDTVAALVRRSAASTNAPEMPTGLTASKGLSSNGLSVGAAQLISSAGLWQALAATLASSTVRASSLLPSIVDCCKDVAETVLTSFGGCLSLAALPDVAVWFFEVLPLPVSSNASFPSHSTDGGESAPQHSHITWTLSQKLQHRMAVVCKTVCALERLLDGSMGALHTLLALEATGAEAVARILSSTAGLGVLAACMQPLMVSSEPGASIVRYSAALLVRVVAATDGAAAVRLHAPWLLGLVKAVQAVASRDEVLVAILSQCEQGLQPAMLIANQGAAALAIRVSALLNADPHGTLVSFDADASIEVEKADFGKKAIATGGEKLAQRVQRNMAAHANVLAASLRALREAAVERKVALALHEVDAMDWLRAMLSNGCSSLWKQQMETQGKNGLWHTEMSYRPILTFERILNDPTLLTPANFTKPNHACSTLCTSCKHV